MFYRVKGKLPNSDNSSTDNIATRLSLLGYELQQNNNNLELSKEGKIESIIDELLPICESLGWNAEKDLYLEEYPSPNSTATAVYNNGRIYREEF